MVDNLLLYLRYAFRSFLRGRSRSVFGAFCVAAGVAGVVALQMVGTNFRHAVTDSSQRTNRGDIAVDANGPDLTTSQAAVFARLQRAGKITGYTFAIDRSATVKRLGGDPALIVSFAAVTAVDPRVYPFYDHIVADQPAGRPLRRILTHPADAAVSADVFDHLRLGLGDRIVVGGRLNTYTLRVRAVLPENAEPFGNSFFGASDFVFVPYSLLGPRPGHAGHVATRVYVTTRSAAQAAAVKPLIVRAVGPTFDVNTAADVLAQAADASRQLNSFLTIMGFVALLIGGIGVVNTMLVTVRRRVREIAVLKALGMKGRQVIGVFLLEALMLGVLGSALGALLGIAASVVVNAVAVNLVGTALAWHLYLAPLVVGVVVGVLASAVFAFLPVLRAGDTRPLAVLQEEAAVLPRGPRWRGVVATLILAAVMGIAAAYLIDVQTSLPTVVVGLIIGYGVFLVVAAFLAIFLGIVWLISKLPGFGLLTLRLAFRNMGRQRRRLAATLLALFIGILAVGSVAIVAGNVKASIAAAFGTQLHANVLLFSSASPRIERDVLRVVHRLPGVRSVEQSTVAIDAQLSAVNGVPLATVLRRHARTARSVGELVNGLFGRDLRIARFGDKLSAGRVLSRRDIGTSNAVVLGRLAADLGLRLGDRLTYADPNGAVRVTVRIVGIVKARSVSFTFGTTIDNALTRHFVTAAPSLFGDYDTTYLEIADKNLSRDVTVLRRSLPRAFTLDLSALIPLFNRLIDRLALFPEIIAALALVAGAVIIANTVALAVLERQREIAVMKAVGARSGTILRLLLVENAVVGLVGALMGVLAALLTVVILDRAVLNIAPSVDPLTAVALVALGVVLAVAASALSAWSAARQTPLGALRYE